MENEEIIERVLNRKNIKLLEIEKIEDVEEIVYTIMTEAFIEMGEQEDEIAKNNTPFSRWIKETSLNGYLHRGGIHLRHINKIKTELFVFNNEEGKPLCIFEVGKDFDVTREYTGFLLKKMPPWSLKIPGYMVLYRKMEGRGECPIVNFRVRKFTPIERFVGDFSPREFAGFLTSTVTFLRKKHNKENGQ